MAPSIQLVFDTHDPGREGEFWAAALGYRVQAPPQGYESWEAFARERGIPEEHWNDRSAIVDPDGGRPRIYFQKVPEGKTAKNRMHLDLGVTAGPASPLDERRRLVGAEVERLKALGATDGRGAMEENNEYWIRMNDPEGNEFCVQ